MNSGEQYLENLILAFCAILLFLLNPKYNVFRSENLQNDIVQYYICHDIFWNFLKYLYSKNLDFKEEEKAGGSMVPEQHLEFPLFTQSSWIMYPKLIVH
jgi:hypothetical protein